MKVVDFRNLFWELFFGSVDVFTSVWVFANILKDFTNLNDYVTFDDKDDDADFRYNYTEKMIAQFKQNFLIKSFSHQDQDKRDDCLQRRNQFWPNYFVVNEGASIPGNVYDYDSSDPGINYFFRG